MAPLRRSPPANRPLPAPGEESVWDYPRPPRVERTTRELRVAHAGVAVAATGRGLRVLETAGAPVYYFPPDDVRREFLEPSRRTTLCEWKGTASYFDLAVPGAPRVADAAWTYRAPSPGYEAIRDHVAFYAGKVDEATVDGERARPQAGGFYGGWITRDVLGPFKGEPGTSGW